MVSYIFMDVAGSRDDEGSMDMVSWDNHRGMDMVSRDNHRDVDMILNSNNRRIDGAEMTAEVRSGTSLV